MARVKALMALLIGSATALGPLATPAGAQEIGVIGHTAIVSRRGAELRFDLADGETLQIALQRGRLRINGSTAGRYTRGGDVEQTWRALLESTGSLETAEMLHAVHEWSMDVSGVEGYDLATMETIHETVVRLTAVQAAIPAIPPGPEVPTAPPAPATPDVDVAVDLGDIGEITAEAVELGLAEAAAALRELEARGDAKGVEQALRELEIQRAALAAKRAELEAQRIRIQAEEQLVGTGFTGAVSNIVSEGANLLAMFLALSFMGFGFMFFAPRQLEAVSDTVWHSFGRCFLAGLFAQPLLLPVFGMMIAGLVLTVVGIVVLPFAIVAFLIGLVLAIVGGYVAVARTVGEIYLRRRMARGLAVGGLLNYRYLLYGLGGLLAIWAPSVLFGWVPVAGTVLTFGAALITWVLATAGFGATIISRAGVRGTVVRRLDHALTDEHYWPDTDLPPSRGRTPRSGP